MLFFSFSTEQQALPFCPGIQYLFHIRTMQQMTRLWISICHKFIVLKHLYTIFVLLWHSDFHPSSTPPVFTLASSSHNQVLQEKSSLNVRYHCHVPSTPPKYARRHAAGHISHVRWLCRPDQGVLVHRTRPTLSPRCCVSHVRTLPWRPGEGLGQEIQARSLSSENHQKTRRWRRPDSSQNQTQVPPSKLPRARKERNGASRTCNSRRGPRVVGTQGRQVRHGQHTSRVEMFVNFWGGRCPDGKVHSFLGLVMVMG